MLSADFVGEKVFNGKKRRKIELLTYVMIGFVLVTTLFGGINIYKSCKIINNQANTNFLALAEQVKQRENNYFHATQEESEHCKKTIEITINKKELNKIIPTAYKYNKYKIPYLGDYLNSIISPVLLYSANHVVGIRSIYFIFDPELLVHKYVLGLWYTDFRVKGVFKLTDNGPVTDMHPASKSGLEWYYVPKKLKKGAWSPPYVDNDIKIDMISYSTPVYSGKTFLGIMGADISIDEIKNFIYQFKIYKTGKAYLIDKNNKIIFAKDYKTLTSTNVIDKNLCAFLNNSLTKDGINLQSGKIKLLKSYSATKLFAVTKLYNGFILVLEVPINELYAETIKLITLTTILLVLAVIIVLLITTIANKNIEKINNELTQRAKYTRIILDNIKDGIITINDDFIVESCNLAAEFIFEYSSLEIMGKKIDLLLRHEIEGEDKKACLSSKGRKGCYGIKKNGDEFPVEIDAGEIYIEDKKLTLIVIRDITERHKIDKMKNEFISTISHELRTPLTAIRGALELMASGLLGKLPEKVVELIKMADNNSSRLINLINDILDIEKMESGRMTFNIDVYEIMPIIQQAIEINTSYAEQFNVKLDIEPTIVQAKVNVDKTRLIQILTNLISNAVKFSTSGSIIRILVSHQNNHIRIAVVDKGCGIKEEFRNQVFDKFTQEDSSDSRQKNGTGLGLSISKAIIEQLGGSLTFTTEIGVGSTFYLDLPCLD